MSLTSYRAAPPRVKNSGARSVGFGEESFRGLYRFGGDLLSHVLRRSTIGVPALIFRVREGIGSLAGAMTTKPSNYPN